MVVGLLGRPFLLLMVTAAATLALAGTAFTNSVTTPTSTTSTSASVIGEFTVSNVAYNLNTTDPRNVDSITFTIVNPGTTPSFVRVQPVSGGSWYVCSLAPSGGDQNATCITTSPQWTLVTGLTNMTSLTIIIRD
jgi:hypothetical protein